MVPGFRYNLGFSGGVFKSGNYEEQVLNVDYFVINLTKFVLAGLGISVIICVVLLYANKRTCKHICVISCQFETVHFANVCQRSVKAVNENSFGLETRNQIHSFHFQLYTFLI